MNLHNREDREVYAFVAAAVLIAVVPFVVGLGLVLVGAWLDAIKTIGVINHPRDIHRTLFGWLTHYKTDGDGTRRKSPNAVPLIWIMPLLTLYVLYQACEGASWLIEKVVARGRGRRVQVVESVSPPSTHRTPTYDYYGPQD